MDMKHLTILSAAACFGLLARPGRSTARQPLRPARDPADGGGAGLHQQSGPWSKPAKTTGHSRIVAQSSDFFRSSRIELDGRDAPPLSVFRMHPNLPPGLYEVSAFLIGDQRPARAAVSPRRQGQCAQRRV